MEKYIKMIFELLSLIVLFIGAIRLLLSFLYAINF